MQAAYIYINKFVGLLKLDLHVQKLYQRNNKLFCILYLACKYRLPVTTIAISILSIQAIQLTHCHENMLVLHLVCEQWGFEPEAGDWQSLPAGVVITQGVQHLSCVRVQDLQQSRWETDCTEF